MSDESAMSNSQNLKENLKKLPQVDQMLGHPDLKTFIEKFGRKDLVQSLRLSLAEMRVRILQGDSLLSCDDIEMEIVNRCLCIAQELNKPSLQRVVNATGILIHTNLGRAVLSKKAIELAVEAAGGYTNLEFDLSKGQRGSRMSHLKKHIQELTGAEDALVVNNNAAAVLLMLDTFAKNQEVIVSRGELIEIGGSFRLPDILKKSGAVLVETGCTNRTYPEDYASSITQNTAMLLKSHRSNFAVTGFVRETSCLELTEIAKEAGIISAVDMGSGLLIDLSAYGLSGEPACKELIDSGIDLITFSGDKLLGGPQCGIIIGRKHLVSKMAKNPLTRALRLDKMTIAALEGTLLAYRNPQKVMEEIPFLKMLSKTAEEIKLQSMNLIKRAKEKGCALPMEVVPDYSMTGGGAFPQKGIDTYVIKINQDDTTNLKAKDLHSNFLSWNPPIIGRIHKDSFLLDLRTVDAAEIDILLDKLVHISNHLV